MTKYVGFKVTRKLSDGRVKSMTRVGFTTAETPKIAQKKFIGNKRNVGPNDEVVVVALNNLHRSEGKARLG